MDLSTLSAAASGQCSGVTPLFRCSLSLVLSGASGVRATIPLFLMSILHQTNSIALWDEAAWLGHPAATIILGTALVVEVVADAVPAVDHCLHSALVFLAPVCGMLAAVAPDTCMGWVSSVPMAVIGGIVAFLIHGLKAITRLISTSSSGGCCNPVLSVLGTVGTALLVVAAILVVAFAIIGAVLVVLITIHSLRTMHKRSSAQSEEPARAMLASAPVEVSSEQALQVSPEVA